MGLQLFYGTGSIVTIHFGEFDVHQNQVDILTFFHYCYCS